MSTRNVERELTDLLHRHAEDAMNDTDTQAEHNRLYDVLDAEPGTDRRPLAAVAAVAAVGVAAAVVWSLGGPEGGTGLPPAGDPPQNVSEQVSREAELLADRFMEAFVDHDVAAASAVIRDGAWDGDLENEFAFLDAWYVRYDTEPCRTTAGVYEALVVECRATVHSARSEELGRGPFDGVVYSFVVRGGEIIDGRNDHNHESNGLGDHLDEVSAWIDTHASRADRALMDKTHEELTAGEVDRWVQLHHQYIDAFVEASTDDGDG